MNNVIVLCLKKATELGIQTYSDGFIVACTDWTGSQNPSSLTFDFYLVAEVSPDEGRIAGIPCANLSNNRWHSRSGEPLDFWVCNPSLLADINQLSYFHPSELAGIELSLQPIFSFNTLARMSIATVENRKHSSKRLLKKLEAKRQNPRIQAVQNDVKRFCKGRNDWTAPGCGGVGLSLRDRGVGGGSKKYKTDN